MKLRQLEYFLAVVENGSFSRASAELHVAQPALSQQVRKLEQELGVELLTRGPRGVVANERGKILALDTRQLLYDLERMGDRVRGPDSQPKGRVSLGIPSTLNTVLGVPLIERVKRELPLVSLNVVESMSGYILKMLRDGDLDLALVCHIEHLPGFSIRKVLIEDLYFIAPPDLRLARRRGSGAAPGTIEFADLEQFEYTLPGRPHGLRALIKRYAQQSGVRLRITTDVDALTQIKRLVSRGVGCSILSHAAVADELQAGSLSALRIVKPSVQRLTSIAHRADRPLLRAANEVRSHTLAAIRALVLSDDWRAQLLTEGEADR